MPRVFIVLCLLLQAASAARLTVRVEPRWGDRPLVMDELSLATADQEGMSVSRLAMLLSHAELQRVDGSWIGARDWVALLDAGKGRLSFELPGIPAERFTALRFDLGLDEETDRSDPVQRAAGHPLHPDVCGLHWGWRGGYVFLAIEGRYPRTAGEAGGYSYHLAGQACRGTIEVPVELDLRGDLVLTLAFDARSVFGASHRIDIAAADSMHSKGDGRIVTLEEVIDHYDHGIQSSATLDPHLAKHLSHDGPGLSDKDKQALVAFLKALSDEPQVPASR
jgi:hypothetical protein